MCLGRRNVSSPETFTLFVKRVKATSITLNRLNRRQPSAIQARLKIAGMRRKKFIKEAETFIVSINYFQNI